MKKIDSGFSLLELLVVVAIIGVLAAIGTIGYGQYINSTKEKALTANLQSLSETAKTRLSANELGDSPLKTCFDLVEDLTVKNNNSAKNVYTGEGNVYINGHTMLTSSFSLGQNILMCYDPEATPEDSKISLCACNEDSCQLEIAPAGTLDNNKCYIPKYCTKSGNTLTCPNP